MAWIAPAQAITGTEDVDWDYKNQTGQLPGGGISNGSDGFSGPNFITPAWIERWKGENSLLGNVPGPITIFVNPRAVAPGSTTGGDGTDANAANNESFNYNATLSDLFQRPPTSPNTAVNLSLIHI